VRSYDQLVFLTIVDLAGIVLLPKPLVLVAAKITAPHDDEVFRGSTPIISGCLEQEPCR
jgi:hypothetical protein